MKPTAVEKLAGAIVRASKASGVPNRFALKELCENFGGPTPGAAATILGAGLFRVNKLTFDFGCVVVAYERPRYQYGERVPATLLVGPV